MSVKAATSKGPLIKIDDYILPEDILYIDMPQLCFPFSAEQQLVKGVMYFWKTGQNLL